MASWLVTVLNCGANGPGSGPGREHCVVLKVNVIIHPDTIQVKQFINLFFRNLGLDYQQTFRLKPSVFISEVCHVIVHYHVTNVEERRRGPGPKCETERTGAPPFCSGLGPPPFPITLLLCP